MFYNYYMEAIDRLKLISSHMHLEAAEDTNCPQLSTRKQNNIFISDAVLPNGKRIALLKSQLSTVCERNCFYCPFRSGRDFQRVTFIPDEFAQLFMALHRAKIAQGYGVGGVDDYCFSKFYSCVEAVFAF